MLSLSLTSCSRRLVWQEEEEEEDDDDEEEALEAMALAWLRLKIVVEPGGAVALAAALFHGDAIKGEDVALTVSGGNVDADIFRRALDTL